MKRFLVFVLCVLCPPLVLPVPAFAENTGDRVMSQLQGSPVAPAQDENAAPSKDVTDMLMQLLGGDLVPNEQAALSLAETLIRGKYGDEMLKRNQPLTVRRQGDYWFVRGRKQGSFSSMLRINRVDARVDAALVFDPDDPPFPHVTRPHPGEGDCHTSCHAPDKK